MRDPSRRKLEEYGWERTKETQRGGGYHILNRHHRGALDSSCELPGRPCSMTKPYGIAVRLVGQSRYDLAERQLRQPLQENPEHAASYALLGICLAWLIIPAGAAYPDLAVFPERQQVIGQLVA
jgi:hypothetical protein